MAGVCVLVDFPSERGVVKGCDMWVGTSVPLYMDLCVANYMYKGRFRFEDRVMFLTSCFGRRCRKPPEIDNGFQAAWEAIFGIRHTRFILPVRHSYK